jgi:DNA-binding IclR family transcriptional regulator
MKSRTTAESARSGKAKAGKRPANAPSKTKDARRPGRQPAYESVYSAQAAEDPFADSRSIRESAGIRVVDILQFFRETRRPARATEISAALALPNSSIHKMLKALVLRGYLLFDFEKKLYAPGYRIVSTVVDIEASFYGGPKLRRVLKEIHSGTGQTVCLCVQNDCWVQNVAASPGAHYRPAVQGEGMRMPILGSAPGNVLMAARSDSEILEIARRARDRGYLELDARGVGPLLDLVKRARRDGYSTWPGFSFPGALAIAVPARPLPEAPLVAIVLMAEASSTNKSKVAELSSLMRDTVARRLP